MQSQGAMDHCRRRPIGLCTDAQIRDDGPNMETYHESTYRSSRVSYRRILVTEEVRRQRVELAI